MARKLPILKSQASLFWLCDRSLTDEGSILRNQLSESEFTPISCQLSPVFLLDRKAEAVIRRGKILICLTVLTVLKTVLNWFLYGVSAFLSAAAAIPLSLSRQVGLALRAINKQAGVCGLLSLRSSKHMEQRVLQNLQAFL